MDRPLDKLIERYELAEKAGSEGLWDWDLRTDQIYLSPRFQTLVGLPAREDGFYSAEEWLARVHPDDVEWLSACLEGQVGGMAMPFMIEHRVLDANSTDVVREWRWLICRGVAVNGDDEEPQRLVGSVFDITDRKRIEESLRRSEERYALAARGANDGLWDWQIDTGEVYYSPRWKEMLGLDEQAVAPTLDTWFDRVIPSDRVALEAAMEMHLAGQRNHLEQEVRMLHANGSMLWVLIRGLAARDDQNCPQRIAGWMSDITERKRAELQFQNDVLYDGLTGLASRTLLLDRIGQALDRLNRSGNDFSLLLIDLDQFKQINDSLGTGAGDLVLTSTAVRLILAHRRHGTLARISADEFCLLADQRGDPAAALALAREINALISQPFAVDGRELVLTASIGIALSATGYDNPADMLRDAGLAMYRAKTEGRNRAEVFDTRLRERAFARMDTEAALRRAVERDELSLYYQPIVSLSSGRVTGFEALMRWHHQERGLVPPTEFIPVAEECGLIVSLGRWALHQAAHQLALWQRRLPGAEDLTMAVNVSSRQFADDDLVQVVREVLTQTGLNPRTLTLELTETAFMQNPDRAEAVMRQIRALGVRLSIDDFGTGYSSLAYLQKFPANYLKIDRGFVHALANRQENQAIVKVITTLAASLNLDVCAEGIEQPAEASFLAAINCQLGQGYYFARPAPADAMERRLCQSLIFFTVPQIAAAAAP